MRHSLAPWCAAPVVPERLRGETHVAKQSHDRTARRPTTPARDRRGAYSEGAERRRRQPRRSANPVLRGCYQRHQEHRAVLHRRRRRGDRDGGRCSQARHHRPQPRRGTGDDLRSHRRQRHLPPAIARRHRVRAQRGKAGRASKRGRPQRERGGRGETDAARPAATAGKTRAFASAPPPA